MIRTLQSPWVAAVIGALVYTLTTFALIRPSKILANRPEPAHADATPKVEPTPPSWAFKNPEVDQLVSELRTEREMLRAREKELQDWAARLAVERQEIGTITQRVAVLQAEMDRSMVRIKDDEIANLKKLAKVYSTMAPEASSKIIVELQEDAAVKILALMKESETAPILENVAKSGPTGARKVAVISDRLRLLTSGAPPDRPNTP